MGRSVLCQLGLHKWSTNRAGIKVCRREGCRRARTFGLTGLMRKMEFEEELYEEFRSLETPREGRE